MSKTRGSPILGLLFPLGLFVLTCVGAYLFYFTDLNGITIFSDTLLASGLTVMVVVILVASLITGEKLWGGNT